MSDLDDNDPPTAGVCADCNAYYREIRRLQKMIEGLTARIAAQSELLSKRAERPRADDMITFPSEKHGPPHPEVPE